MKELLVFVPGTAVLALLILLMAAGEGAPPWIDVGVRVIGSGILLIGALVVLEWLLARRKPSQS